MNKIIEMAHVVFKEVYGEKYEVMKSRNGQLTLGGRYSQDFVEFYSKTNEDVVVIGFEEVYELAAPKQAELKETTLKVGDYAKIVSKGQFGGVAVGEIGKIVEGFRNEEDGDHRVDTLDGSGHDYFYYGDIILATDEEVAAAKAEQAEAARWAKIGRKHGELKVGDIVQRSPGFIDVVACVHGGLRLDEGEKLIATVEARFE